MNIILLGYMASGKSIIGQMLAEILNSQFIDLDEYISTKEGMSVKVIFKTKGELYFRKVESRDLKELLLSSNNSVIALGGGTPCYAGNMNVINNANNTTSIYLNVSIPELSKRLFSNKINRPLVAHISNLEDMTEFVGKHVFERLAYYNQADITINANQDAEEVMKSILLELF